MGMRSGSDANAYLNLWNGQSNGSREWIKILLNIYGGFFTKAAKTHGQMDMHRRTSQPVDDWAQGIKREWRSERREMGNIQRPEAVGKNWNKCVGSCTHSELHALLHTKYYYSFLAFVLLLPPCQRRRRSRIAHAHTNVRTNGNGMRDGHRHCRHIRSSVAEWLRYAWLNFSCLARTCNKFIEQLPRSLARIRNEKNNPFSILIYKCVTSALVVESFISTVIVTLVRVHSQRPTCRVVQLLRLLRPTHSASQFPIVLRFERWALRLKGTVNRERTLVEWCVGQMAMEWVAFVFSRIVRANVWRMLRQRKRKKMEESRMEEEKRMKEANVRHSRNAHTHTQIEQKITLTYA